MITTHTIPFLALLLFVAVYCEDKPDPKGEDIQPEEGGKRRWNLPEVDNTLRRAVRMAAAEQMAKQDAKGRQETTEKISKMSPDERLTAELEEWVKMDHATRHRLYQKAKELGDAGPTITPQPKRESSFEHVYRAREEAEKAHKEKERGKVKYGQLPEAEREKYQIGLHWVRKLDREAIAQMTDEQRQEWSKKRKAERNDPDMFEEMMHRRAAEAYKQMTDMERDAVRNQLGIGTRDEL
eukprot:TRINITY_DN113068_c0_g1_i1.p1 TRINITY_DN113068_c0_g1~~TRINITY_DN113068_c0_g1_i1.p1  ORF type:complete len:239 (+),score=23.47 TRINITY_DN113068_c0_g1_i1:54-770(+)